MYEGQGRKLLH